MKLIAAMSGGVDSAVAAARAVEAGHECYWCALSAFMQTHRSIALVHVVVAPLKIHMMHAGPQMSLVFLFISGIWQKSFMHGVVEDFLK